MNVYEMAKRYYPTYWGAERLQVLVESGKLTRAQAEEIEEAKA